MDKDEPADVSVAKKFKSKQDTEIDNSRHLVNKIATLYAERLMNDMSLVVNGIEYPTHRIILCTSSEVFQVMLMNPNWSESRTNRVELQETKACAANFEKFLRYFYTGQISINESTVMPIITLADKYIVKDLMQVCIDYMCNHIASSENYVVSWFQYTLGLVHTHHNLVAQACQDYIKWNFETVAETKDFLNFTPECLCKFLTQNDIVVQNEMLLLKYVMRWLQYHQDTLLEESSLNKDNFTLEDAHTQMNQLVENVVSYIRFPMMNRKELAQLLLSPLVRSHKEFFIDRMTIGVAYHSGSLDDLCHIVHSKRLEDRLLFTPRLYTDAKFSSPLHISHFDSMPPYHSRTLVFTSHSNPSDKDDDERPVEWVIDVYPKGVWFDKFSLIVWQGTIELPQVIKKTVRVSITCKDPPVDENEDLRVKFGILVYGIQNKIEYVKTVKHKTLRFNEKERVFNFDDVINYDELNPAMLKTPPAQHGRVGHGTGGGVVTGGHSTEKSKRRSAHLCDNVLKFNLIIIPLSEYSVTESCYETQIRLS